MIGSTVRLDEDLLDYEDPNDTTMQDAPVVTADPSNLPPATEGTVASSAASVPEKPKGSSASSSGPITRSRSQQFPHSTSLPNLSSFGNSPVGTGGKGVPIASSRSSGPAPRFAAARAISHEQRTSESQRNNSRAKGSRDQRTLPIPRSVPREGAVLRKENQRWSDRHSPGATPPGLHQDDPRQRSIPHGTNRSRSHALARSDEERVQSRTSRSSLRLASALAVPLPSPQGTTYSTDSRPNSSKGSNRSRRSQRRSNISRSSLRSLGREQVFSSPDSHLQEPRGEVYELSHRGVSLHGDGNSSRGVDLKGFEQPLQPSQQREEQWEQLPGEFEEEAFGEQFGQSFGEEEREEEPGSPLLCRRIVDPAVLPSLLAHVESIVDAAFHSYTLERESKLDQMRKQLEQLRKAQKDGVDHLIHKIETFDLNLRSDDHFTSPATTLRALKADVRDIRVQFSELTREFSVAARAASLERESLRAPSVETKPDVVIETSTSPTPAVSVSTSKSSDPKLNEFPTFNGQRGSSDHNEFIQKMDAIILANDLTDKKVMAKLPNLFKGNAEHWYYLRVAELPVLVTWDEWREAIRARFETPLYTREKRSLLSKLTYNGEDEPLAWWDKFVRLVRQLHPHATQAEVYDMLLDRLPVDMRTPVQLIIAQSGPSLSDFGAHFESIAIGRNPNAGRIRVNRDEKRIVGNYRNANNYPSAPPKKVDSTSREKRKSDSSPSTEISCYNCNQPGHYASSCPEPRKPRPRGKVQALGYDEESVDEETPDDEEDHSVASESSPSDDDEYHVNALGFEKHSRAYESDSALFESESFDQFSIKSVSLPDSLPVYERAADTHAPVNVLPEDIKSILDSSKICTAQPLSRRAPLGQSYKKGFPITTSVVLDNSVMRACVDTGAGPSVIDESTLFSIDPEYERKLLPVDALKFTAFGSKLSLKGIYNTSIIFPHPRGSIQISVELVVIPATTCPSQLILGNDTLHAYGFDIHTSNGRWFTIGGNKQKFQITNDGRKRYSPFSLASVAALSDSDSLESTTPEPATSARPAPSAAESKTKTSIPLRTDPGAKTPYPKEFEEAIKLMQFGPKLSSKQVDEMLEVIRDYPMVFAHGKQQIGNVTRFKCELKLNTTDLPAKIKQRPYPVSPPSRVELKKLVDELVRMGIVRPSSSMWAHPAILVSHNGKFRLAINFKMLNTMTDGDSYPIPRIDGIVHDNGGKNFMSALDANKGYNQVPISDESIPLTAFVTPDGQYEYVRMPLGLKNAPAIFQRAMNETFRYEIVDGWLRIYIDDTLVSSEKWTEHLRHVRHTLATFERDGWTLSPAKCRFGFDELVQLGHKISGLTIAVDDKKVAAVKDWKTPRNLHEIQGFLGFAGYYRKFIEGYAAIARPLTRLLSKDVVYDWTTACEEAFKTLKEKLLSAPVLGQPDFTQPFQVYLDASGLGLGAVLQQKQPRDGALHDVVLCYISRQLKDSESRYGATQLECLALVWALEKLHLFLDGAQFEVFTDCVAIRALLDLRTPNRHMLRWQLAIQEYRGRMTIIHRPGKANANADALSRFPLPNDSSNPAADLDVGEEPRIHALAFTELDDSFFQSVVDGYNKNSDYKVIVDSLKDAKTSDNSIFVAVKDKKLRSYFEAGRFFLLDSLLYRRSGVSASLVVADPLTRSLIISSCHDEILSGHLSSEKTLSRVKPIAWWPTVVSDIEDYCSSCEACQRALRRTGKPYGLAVKIESPSGPWSLINMDFVTALPPGGKNKYDSVLVVVDRFSRRKRFLLTHANATAPLTARLFFEGILREHGVPTGIITDRDKLFVSEFWKSLAGLCGFKLKLSTAYHPQTDGLAERSIQSLEDMLRRFCAFNPEWEDSEGITRDWTDLLPALEFAINSVPNASSGKSPFVLERGYNPKNVYSLVTSKLPTSITAPATEVFAQAIANAHSRAQECIQASVDAAKTRWDQKHVTPPFKIGDLVFVSTVHFRFGNSSKLTTPYVGPFAITHMVGTNAARVALTAPYDRKHNVFPVSLLKLYRDNDPQRFPNRPKVPFPRPDIIDNEPEWELEAILDDRTRRVKGKQVREFKVSWKGFDEHWWLPESDLGNASDLLNEYKSRPKRKPNKPRKN